MKVCKWGYSLAIRLPAAIVEDPRVERGDDFEIHVAGTRRHSTSRENLPGRNGCKRLRRFRGMLPAGFQV